MPAPLHPGQFRDSNNRVFTYIDDEATYLDEVHQGAGFTKRDPAYLLEKHKAKQERKKK
jgi:hypothetical protein